VVTHKGIVFNSRIILKRWLVTACAHIRVCSARGVFGTQTKVRSSVRNEQTPLASSASRLGKSLELIVVEQFLSCDDMTSIYMAQVSQDHFPLAASSSVIQPFIKHHE
jgi:hypothetical protein